MPPRHFDVSILHRDLVVFEEEPSQMPPRHFDVSIFTFDDLERVADAVWSQMPPRHFDVSIQSNGGHEQQ